LTLVWVELGARNVATSLKSRRRRSMVASWRRWSTVTRN
jgi:hypothetical protein